MMYLENPKTKGSGIYGCYPQVGYCPLKCPECYFNNGRSYLEPIEQTCPNMPPLKAGVVRVNDVGDSNIHKQHVLKATEHYPEKFYNTAIPDLSFPAPVVLTINPGKLTDTDFYKLDPPPKNLMFVRFRSNTWNFNLRQMAINYYSSENIPIVLTWMAYHDIDSIPIEDRHYYELRKRTLNSYWAIRGEIWQNQMDYHRNQNGYVYSCGNEKFGGGCKACGNCLREYHRTKELLK
jgi:hypothetical protein